MTGIAVVASAQDAKFAEEVRAALQAAGRDASVSPSLPKATGSQVVLIWSAALEAGHAIDAQALIGLWSEDRLLVARRDATPLPLGLRDLPSLPPSATAEEVCAAVPGVRFMAVGSPVGRAAQVDIGSTVESTESATEAPRAKMPAGTVIAVLVAIALLGGGVWYYFNKSSIEKQAALTAALETATNASQELQQAQAKQFESLKALEQARAAEDGARKAGDPAKLKEAQEAAKRAEAEAARQAEFVKQREAAAADARRKAAEGALAAKSATAKAEDLPKATVAAARPVAEAPNAEAPKVETPSEAPVEAAKSAPGPRSMSRSERERMVDEEAARKALAASDKTPSTTPKAPVQVASAAPSEPAPGDPQAKAAPDFDALYQQAVALEQDGKAPESIRIYRRAARAGSGKAAKRLGEIYDKGVPGVSRDYAESLQWYETARQLGEHIETAGRRGGPEVPIVVAPVPVIPETAKSAPETVAVVKSAPAVREPMKAGPVPAAKPAPVPEPVKAAEPVPVPAPAPAPEPPKSAAPVPSPAPASETKPGWFSMRGLLIALLVLGLIAWRRARRREKAAARSQRASAATVDLEGQTTVAKARFSRGPQTADQHAPPAGDSTLFVSYSHKDRPRVEPIVSVIEEMGRKVWIDRTDITGQTGWAGQIVRAIRECRAVVLMASPNSYTSDQVVRELYLAMNHRKTIVPIEIEPADMPDELQYILAPFQHHRLSAGETRAVLGRALAAV